MIYFDWAATAKPRKEINKIALERSFKLYGNPSSLHTEGVAAKEALEDGRNRCGNILGCKPSQLFFTSGGSESNSIVLLSFLKKHLVGEVITSSIEHPSVLEPIQTLKTFGWKVITLNPDNDGILSIKKLSKSINEKTKLISLIHVHNETGKIQPIDEMVKIIRDRESELGTKIHIHIDGVQAVTKIKLNINSLMIDSYSISGHKFGAPRGIGLLYLRKQKDVLIKGGGQEGGIRPGTQNLFGVLALTECLEVSIEELESTSNKLKALMEIIINNLKELNIYSIPKTRKPLDSGYVPNIISVTTPPVPGEVLVRVLNSKGIMASTGSACSSNKKSTTSGLLTMGITKDEGFSSFRISIGRDTSKDEIEYLCKTVKESVNELKP